MQIDKGLGTLKSGIDVVPMFIPDYRVVSILINTRPCYVKSNDSIVHLRFIYGNFFFQNWCGKYRDETMKKKVLTGVHSPPEFRVIGPLSNSEQFSQDWNCPVNSPMNPEEKCTVW